MNLEDFYRGRGEDYPVIIGRFMGNENLLKKFVKNFPDDPTYGRLCEAMEAKDWPQVEMSAHTLKGVAANLSFSKLFQASADLVPVYRFRLKVSKPRIYAGFGIFSFLCFFLILHKFA